MNLIEGVHLHDLPLFGDARGSLVVFEEGAGLPFGLGRCFFLKMEKRMSSRALRASASDLLLAVAAGSLVADIDNGMQRTSLSLRDRRRGLWIRRGLDITLRNQADLTIVFACEAAVLDDVRKRAASLPDILAA